MHTYIDTEKAIIEELAPIAKAGAMKLKARFPQAIITSGRRDLRKQAAVMAINEHKSPGWLKSTYKNCELFVDWMDRNKPVSQAELFDGFHAILTRMPNPNTISKHLTGEAFDIEPMVDDTGLPTNEGYQIIDFCRRLPGVEKVLLREGGLTIWHVQFREEAKDV